MREPRIEPPIAEELAETYTQKASAIIRLLDVREKHAKRKAVTQPYPVFPIEDGVA